MTSASSNVKQILNDIYEKGKLFYKNNSLNLFNNYSITEMQEYSHYDCNNYAILFGEELLKDNINHIALEVYNENSVFNSSKSKMIKDIAKCFSNEDVMYSYLYNKVTRHKSYNKLKEDLPRIIIKNNSFNLLMSETNEMNIPLPELYVWLHLFRDKFSLLVSMDKKDVKNIISDILCSNILKNETFVKKIYTEEKDTVKKVLCYYFLEQIFRFSLIYALDDYIHRNSYNIFHHQFYNHLNTLTVIDNPTAAHTLYELIPLCLHYPFAYEKIINELGCIYNQNPPLYISIVSICIQTKQYCKKLLQDKYIDKLISLDDLKIYIDENINYYSPNNKTNRWIKSDLQSDDAYIVNITSLINIFNMQTTSENYSYKHHNYFHNFPYNQIYIDYMTHSNISYDDKLLLKQAYENICTEDNTFHTLHKLLPNQYPLSETDIANIKNEYCRLAKINYTKKT